MGVRKGLQRWLPAASSRQSPLRVPLLWQHPAVESFAIQTHYDRYGAQLYARAAKDPAFAAAVAAIAAEFRSELLSDREAAPDLLRGDATAVHSYLLGAVHGTLSVLLNRTVQAELGERPAREQTDIAVRLGATFHLGFDAGLINMTPRDAPLKATFIIGHEAALHGYSPRHGRRSTDRPRPGLEAPTICSASTTRLRPSPRRTLRTRRNQYGRRRFPPWMATRYTEFATEVDLKPHLPPEAITRVHDTLKKRYGPTTAK